VFQHALFKKDMNAGMNILFRGLVSSFEESCASDSVLSVVSASPFFLKSRVAKLLTFHQFPSFDVHLRPLMEKNRDFKVRVLTKIFETKPGPFLLFGDDIHEDPEIYQAIKDKYPDKILDIYIHGVKKRDLPEGQINYLTAFDLAIKEYQKGRVSLDVLQEIGFSLMNSSPWKVIPLYGHCPLTIDFMAFYEEIPYPQLVEKIQKRILEMCRARTY
jgi:phosphatidate phosphatase APP1